MTTSGNARVRASDEWSGAAIRSGYKLGAATDISVRDVDSKDKSRVQIGIRYRGKSIFDD